MEFLVEFKVHVPAGTSESEVKDRESAEAAAATKLAQDGHLVRVWKPRRSTGETNVARPVPRRKRKGARRSPRGAAAL